MPREHPVEAGPSGGVLGEAGVSRASRAKEIVPRKPLMAEWLGNGHAVAEGETAGQHDAPRQHPAAGLGVPLSALQVNGVGPHVHGECDEDEDDAMLTADGVAGLSQGDDSMDGQGTTEGQQGHREMQPGGNQEPNHQIGKGQGQELASSELGDSAKRGSDDEGDSRPGFLAESSAGKESASPSHASAGCQHCAPGRNGRRRRPVQGPRSVFNVLVLLGLREVRPRRRSGAGDQQRMWDRLCSGQRVLDAELQPGLGSPPVLHTPGGVTSPRAGTRRGNELADRCDLINTERGRAQVLEGARPPAHAQNWQKAGHLGSGNAHCQCTSKKGGAKELGREVEKGSEVLPDNMQVEEPKQGGHPYRATNLAHSLDVDFILCQWGERDSLKHYSATYCPLFPAPRSTIAAAFSPDGTTLASTHGDHTVKVLSCSTGKCLKTLTGHRRTPWVVRYHPCIPDIVASGSLDHEVRLWNLNTSSSFASHQFYRPIASLAFHAQGHLLAVASGRHLYIWEHTKSGEAGQPVIILKTRRSLRAVHFHPHGAPLLLTAEVNALESSDCVPTLAMSSGYLDYPPPTLHFLNGGVASPLTSAAAAAAGFHWSREVSPRGEAAGAAPPGDEVEASRGMRPGDSALAQGLALFRQVQQQVGRQEGVTEMAVDGLHEDAQRHRPGGRQAATNEQAPSGRQQAAGEQAAAPFRAPWPHWLWPGAAGAEAAGRGGIMNNTGAPQAAVGAGRDRDLGVGADHGTASRIGIGPGAGRVGEQGTDAHVLAPEHISAFPTRMVGRMPQDAPTEVILAEDILAELDAEGDFPGGDGGDVDMQQEGDGMEVFSTPPESTAELGSATADTGQFPVPREHWQEADHSSWHAATEARDETGSGTEAGDDRPLGNGVAGDRKAMDLARLRLQDGADKSVIGGGWRAHAASGLEAALDAEAAAGVGAARNPQQGNAEETSRLTRPHAPRGPEGRGWGMGRGRAVEGHQRQWGGVGRAPATGIGDVPRELGRWEVPAGEQRGWDPASLAGAEQAQQRQRQRMGRLDVAHRQGRGWEQQEQAEVEEAPQLAGRGAQDAELQGPVEGVPASMHRPGASGAGARLALPPGRGLPQQQPDQPHAEAQQQAQGQQQALSPEVPCTVKLKLWHHSEERPKRELDPATACRLTIPHAVLCSEMGAHFSPCGRFLAACVACVPRGDDLHWGDLVCPQTPAKGAPVPGAGPKAARARDPAAATAGHSGAARPGVQHPGPVAAGQNRCQVMREREAGTDGHDERKPGEEHSREQLNEAGRARAGQGAGPGPRNGVGSLAPGRTGHPRPGQGVGGAGGENWRDEGLGREQQRRRDQLGSEDRDTQRQDRQQTRLGHQDGLAEAWPLGAPGNAPVLQGGKAQRGQLVSRTQPPQPIVYELRVYSVEGPLFGQVLAARGVRAAHCLTSIQFSPTSSHLLLAYGRRHSSLLRSIVVNGPLVIPIYTILEVYRVSDMSLVHVLTSAEDEVNVASFHPKVGSGLVYGTKEGKLRLFQHSRVPSTSLPPYGLPEGIDYADGGGLPWWRALDLDEPELHDQPERQTSSVSV